MVDPISPEDVMQQITSLYYPYIIKNEVIDKLNKAIVYHYAMSIREENEKYKFIEQFKKGQKVLHISIRYIDIDVKLVHDFWAMENGKTELRIEGFNQGYGWIKDYYKEHGWNVGFSVEEYGAYDEDIYIHFSINPNFGFSIKEKSRFDMLDLGE